MKSNNKKVPKKFLVYPYVLNFLKGLIAIPSGFITTRLISSITNFTIKGLTEKVLSEALYFAIFIISYKFLCFILEMIYGRILATATQKFKLSVYKGFLQQPPWIAAKFGVGRTIESFTNDIEQTVGFYTNTIPQFINSIIMMLTYTIYLMTKNIWVAFTLLAIGVIQLLPPIVVKKYLVQNYENTREVEAQVTEHIVAGCEGIMTIKLYELKKWYINKICKIYKRYLKVGIKAEAVATSENIMDNTLSYLLKFGTYFIIGWLVVIGITNMDNGLQSIVLSTQLYSSIRIIFNIIPNILVSRRSEERIIELSVLQNSDYKKIELNKNAPVYSIKNLFFAYGENTILDNVNLEIREGDIVVIQGANGQGKSTFINILLGLLNRYTGNVFFYGTDMKFISPYEYIKYISAVIQEENGFDKSPKEIFEMLHIAGQIDLNNAVDLALEMGLTYDNLNNDKLSNLSGGEFKKVYITAALLKKCSVLFLDKPGNSLDERAKSVLKEKILSCGKTAILITHDPYFMDAATLIAKVNDGKITTERREFYEKACYS